MLPENYSSQPSGSTASELKTPSLSAFLPSSQPPQLAATTVDSSTSPPAIPPSDMNQSSYEYVLDQQPSPKSQPPELHFPSIAYPRHAATGSACAPKPHPHLASHLFQPQTSPTDVIAMQTSPVIYINSYPHDLPNSLLLDCLEGSPVKITLPPAVLPDVRLMPDVYYDWMPRSGTWHQLSPKLPPLIICQGRWNLILWLMVGDACVNYVAG